MWISTRFSSRHSGNPASAHHAGRRAGLPDQAVRIIVPFPPGGVNDIVARIVAQQLSDRLGKQFIVDNRAGAGGVVGTELVAHCAQ